MRVVDVTRAKVLTFRDALPIGNGSKNRVTAVLSGIMRHAELLDLRRAGSNPCKGLRRRSTGFKATYLTHAEFKALGRTLTDVREAHPEAAALIRFLALSGCRKGEAQSLRWDWYDGGRVALSEAKSGPRSIWLGMAARDLLDEMPHGSCFIDGLDDRPLQDLRQGSASPEKFL